MVVNVGAVQFIHSLWGVTQHHTAELHALLSAHLNSTPNCYSLCQRWTNNTSRPTRTKDV